MKMSKVFVFTLMCAVTGSINTYANNPISNPNNIRLEILDLVSTIDLAEMEADSERVKVQFMVNNKNEIIVLNLSETQFENAIKTRLNYKKVDVEGIVKNKIYTLPVVFNKE